MNLPRLPPIQQKASGPFNLILAGGLARGLPVWGLGEPLRRYSSFRSGLFGVSIGAIIGAWLCKEGGTGEALAGLRNLARTMQGDLCAKGGSFGDVCGD